MQLATNELYQVLSFLARPYLDVLCLTCKQLNYMIQKHFEQSPLRVINSMQIQLHSNLYRFNYSTPFSKSPSPSTKWHKQDIEGSYQQIFPYLSSPNTIVGRTRILITPEKSSEPFFLDHYNCWSRKSTSHRFLESVTQLFYFPPKTQLSIDFWNKKLEELRSISHLWTRDYLRIDFIGFDQQTSWLAQQLFNKLLAVQADKMLLQSNELSLRLFENSCVFAVPDLLAPKHLSLANISWIELAIGSGMNGEQLARLLDSQANNEKCLNCQIMLDESLTEPFVDSLKELFKKSEESKCYNFSLVYPLPLPLLDTFSLTNQLTKETVKMTIENDEYVSKDFFKIQRSLMSDCVTSKNRLMIPM
uniref:F-box domain-containing protein n=1 Tax=Ditylenchus dipsaci TaxID=166011 RepID=A0A915CUD5_9BILA